MTTVVDHADQRIVAGTTAVLSWDSTDHLGAPANPGGVVTVTVTRSSGAAVVTGGATTSDAAQEHRYLRALTAGEVGSQPDQLTATWLVGGSPAATTTVDVAGRLWATLAEIRASDPTLQDPGRFPNVELAELLHEVEIEAEWITGQAWVPRWRRWTTSGVGDRTLKLPDPELRQLISVTVDGVALDVAQLRAGPGPTVTRLDGGVWRRDALVVVAYRHGANRPPRDLQGAAMWRLLDMAHTPTRNRMMDRASRMTAQDGTSFELDRASVRRTGLPHVDAVYGRYSAGGGEGGQATAGARLDYDPQSNSIFHAGRQ